MSDAAALAAKLEAEGEKLVGFMTTLEDRHWHMEVYNEGAPWTVRSILAHLVATERAYAKLFGQILEGGTGAPEDFDIDRYNARQQNKTRDIGPPALLEQYRGARAEMVLMVRGLTDLDLERQGRHPYLGVTTLREMVKLVYIHNQIHYRDVRSVLKVG